MKKTTLLFLFLCFYIGVHSQSYIGYLSDNYSGVNSVISNPANIVDSRFKTDINLVGASALLGTDYYAVGFSELDSDFDFDDESLRTPTTDNNIFGNADIMGPSFMFNITPKHSLAIFTRGRMFYNVNEFNGESFELIEDDFENENFNYDEGDVFVTGTAWAEIGLSYGAVLMDKQEHFLKGGISISNTLSR